MRRAASAGDGGSRFNRAPQGSASRPRVFADSTEHLEEEEPVTDLVLPSRISEGDFGGWLRDAMADRRMSQRVLAMRSGVDHSTISRLLGPVPRMPSLSTAIAIVKVFSVPNLGEGSGRPPWQASNPTAVRSSPGAQAPGSSAAA